MTLGDLIKQYRTSKNLSMEKFSQKSGLSKSYIGFLEKGVNPKTDKKITPSIPIIKKVADAINMDFETVLRTLDSSTEIIVGENIFDELNDKPLTSNNFLKAEGIKIPVLGYVAAGVPMDAVENVIDWEEISEEMARSGEYFGLVINGDSMEPRICKGDVVIVKKQSDVDSGDIAIVLVNGDKGTCKKVVKHENGISLISFNPVYPPVFFTWSEVEKTPVQINGKVVELRGKF